MPTETWAYLGFILLLAVLRLGELAISKRNKAAFGGEVSQLRETVFPWMVVLHSSFFVVVPLELLLRRPDFGGPVSWGAIAVTLVALVLRIWTLKTMGRSWNVRVVNGPDYPIVDTGPYRFIRHPNYVVVFLELLFIPLIYKLGFSAGLLTLGNLWVMSRRIPAEEEVLLANPQWRERMAHKPRFFPRGRSAV